MTPWKSKAIATRRWNSMMGKEMDKNWIKEKQKRKKLFGWRQNPSAGAHKNWSEWLKRHQQWWKRKTAIIKKEIKERFLQRERALTEKRARPRQTTGKDANLDEATPGKAAQRETETFEVGGEDETPVPLIWVATQRIAMDNSRQRKVHAQSLWKNTQKEQEPLLLREQTLLRHTWFRLGGKA